MALVSHPRPTEPSAAVARLTDEDAAPALRGDVIDVDAASASGTLNSEVPLSDAEPSEPSGPKLVIRSNTVSGDLRVFRAA